jgi:serine/threonine-protein kinase
MAAVYLARVVGAGGFERLVALKIMHPHIAGDPAFVAMFLDEARLAARIHHPNVVATLDIDQTEEDGLFIMMEYIEGLSIRQINRRLRPGGCAAQVPVALRIVLDALSGLHAAHELTEVNGTPLHLVHRDVSPPNLLVGVDGVTRVSDFGIARAKARLGMSTKRGELKGKVGYMAPEQLQSAPVDRRIDIYAVGVVLWELLTNHKAFRGESEAATMVRALEGLSQMPSELNPLVPHEIDEVCARALAREPAHRIPTAAAFADELERAAHAARVPIASARTVGAFVKELSEPDTK